MLSTVKSFSLVDIDVHDIPEVNPEAELHLMSCIREEVAAFTANIQGTKCLLCPFRRFTRVSRLKAHLKYHCEERIYLADSRSKQRAVVRAYYDYRCSIVPLVSFDSSYVGLLRKSASLIESWNSNCSAATLAVLEKQNLPILVRVLTHTGPEYWVKELTERCIRHSRNLYYTVQFANLFLSILMTNEGRILKSVDALHLHFGTTSEVSGLLPSFRLTWNDIAEVLATSKEFTTKIQELKYKAARAGELTVVTHDETFKSLFALIGQKKMAQAMGELHALHTFRGYTGCTFGISPQRSTSDECFRNAVQATFDSHLAAKVRFVFSDSPLRIIRGARACFDSLLAVGEDPLHLAIRLEYCWGGKVCGPSVRVRELHRKFSI